MKNNKGFTLVELLTVIVILAIILAIAVPGISKILDGSKKSAFEADAKMLITGINYKNLEAGFGEGDPIEEGHILTDVEIEELGGTKANYTTVKVISLTPVTICVETPSNSKFGEQKAVVTKSGIDTDVQNDLNATTCELYGE
jgi:prepilin-type N-terminal cleavage/methylation domain-containing protein